MRYSVALALVGFGVGAWACAPDGSPEPTLHDDEPAEELATATSALSPNDNLETIAADPSCSSAVLKGLATQIAEEVQCLRPSTFARIDNLPGVTLRPTVFPYLQAPAANALKAAQKARGTTMTVNSAYRTIAQQYVLYRQFQMKRCGITLAAPPGGSNHESGIALDIQDYAGWRPSMEANKFRWLGASDVVHFDYVGGSTVDLREISVRAYQRLWNRNHPEDPIGVDGQYGPQTASRLAKTPGGGFPKGADCGNGDAGAPDASVEPAPEQTEPPVVPDAQEPDSDAEPESVETGGRPAPAADAGCTAFGAGTAGSTGSTLGLGVLAAVATLGRALRRRRR